MKGRGSLGPGIPPTQGKMGSGRSTSSKFGAIMTGSSKGSTTAPAGCTFSGQQSRGKGELWAKVNGGMSGCGTSCVSSASCMVCKELSWWQVKWELSKDGTSRWWTSRGLEGWRIIFCICVLAGVGMVWTWKESPVWFTDELWAKVKGGMSRLGASWWWTSGCEQGLGDWGIIFCIPVLGK